MDGAGTVKATSVETLADLVTKAKGEDGTENIALDAFTEVTNRLIDELRIRDGELENAQAAIDNLNAKTSELVDQNRHLSDQALARVLNPNSNEKTDEEVVDEAIEKFIAENPLPEELYD